MTHYPGGLGLAFFSLAIPAAVCLINLLHQPLQMLSVLPQAALHPAHHFGVQLAVAGEAQVVF
uniref:Uncharacterized protein n=1 Tax=Anguilla anguilla TaxID=7936 RepID=A0A0E9RDJ2_ANGAN